MEFLEFADRLVSILFPQRCVLCGDVVTYDDYWCGQCACPQWQALVPNTRYPCAAPLLYEGAVREAVLALKRRTDKRVVRFLSEQMKQAVEQHWKDVVFHSVVPVPAQPEKLRQKGYNHAALLAVELACMLEVPVLERSLERKADSAVQHSLTREERLENAKRSYRPGNAVVSGTVLLVDDIFTTGATAQACRECLLEMGAREVYVLTAAWVPLE